MNLKLLLISLIILFISGCNSTEVAIVDTSQTMITQTSSHHEIHKGYHYTVDDKVTLGSNGQRNLLIVTPPCINVTYDHMVFSISSSGIITTGALYENVTYSVIGTVTPIHNRNRPLNYVSLSNVYIIPTITSTGEELSNYHWGSRHIGGSVRDSEEFILKCDTNYLIRVISDENENLVTIKLDWYEKGIEN